MQKQLGVMLRTRVLESDCLDLNPWEISQFPHPQNGKDNNRVVVRMRWESHTLKSGACKSSQSMSASIMIWNLILHGGTLRKQSCFTGGKQGMWRMKS